MFIWEVHLNVIFNSFSKPHNPRDSSVGKAVDCSDSYLYILVAGSIPARKTKNMVSFLQRGVLPAVTGVGGVSGRQVPD